MLPRFAFAPTRSHACVRRLINLWWPDLVPMASTFNAFELLQGNGAAASAASKKKKKKTPTPAETTTCSTAGVDGAPKPTNGTKASTKPSAGDSGAYQAEMQALSSTLPSTGKQRVEMWASWASKVRVVQRTWHADTHNNTHTPHLQATSGQLYTAPDRARVPYAIVFYSTPALEHTMASVVSNPPSTADVPTLGHTLHALLDPAGLETAADSLLDTAVSLGKAMVGASSELVGLAGDAVSSIAHNLRRTAAAQLHAVHDMQGQLASVDAEVHALEQAMQRSSNNAWWVYMYSMCVYKGGMC